MCRSPQRNRGDDRGNQRLHRLRPAELCRDEQVMGPDAASGSQPRSREEGEGTSGAEDSGGHQPGAPQPARGRQRGQVQTGVLVRVCRVGLKDARGYSISRLFNLKVFLFLLRSTGRSSWSSGAGCELQRLVGTGVSNGVHHSGRRLGQKAAKNRLLGPKHSLSEE